MLLMIKSKNDNYIKKKKKKRNTGNLEINNHTVHEDMQTHTHP